MIVEPYILELDTTIKVGGGVAFTIGGTRQVPVIVKTYNGNAYASAHEADEISGTLKAKGGSLCGLGGAKP